MKTPHPPKVAQVRLVRIDEGAAGQRLDNFLLTELKGASRSLVYRIVRKGEVRVNKGRAKPSHRLAAGDVVRIPPLRLPEAPPRRKLPAALAARLESSILFEDEHLLVLDKPAGWAVHGGSGLSFAVIEGLRELRPHAPFLELAHRLDRDTSGVLLVAKSRQRLLELHDLWRGTGMEKRYLALLAGRWVGPGRTVEAPLARTARRGRERLMEVSLAPGGAAVSHFRPLRIWRDHTLVEVRIDTGRTHQIRVHAASLGHPVVGDAKYGDFEVNRQARRQGLKRQFLHAAGIAFRLPASGRRYAFESALPADLAAYLEGLE